MSIHRRAAKRDINEGEIIDALRAVGASVYPVSGAGIPDTIVIFRGQVYLLEVKNRGGKLTEAQETFFSVHGDLPAVRVVRTVDEALFAVGAIEAPPAETPRKPQKQGVR